MGASFQFRIDENSAIGLLCMQFCEKVAKERFLALPGHEDYIGMR